MDANELPDPAHELVEKDPCYAIVGVAFSVHRDLGHGFLELVYQLAMDVAFREKGLDARRDVLLPVFFRGRPLTTFKPDFRS